MSANFRDVCISRGGLARRIASRWWGSAHTHLPVRGASLGKLRWFLLLALSAASCSALTFNITYDSSTASAPAAFFTAFNYAAALYEGAFDDPITINVQVGWGKINGANLGEGNRAQTANFQLPFTFSQVRNALAGDATSADDDTSVASLPTVDPTGSSTTWVMSRAEAKALGLLAGDDRNLHPSTGLARPDGYIGFMSSATAYGFDPNKRGEAGKYDFIGIASHELTELMGRYGQGQTLTGAYCALDLFRFLSPGKRDLALANSGAYFSIDGGKTVLNTFRGKLGGDPSDWLGDTLDSYNAVANPGQFLAISTGDIIAMDVIGYNLKIPALKIASAGNEVVLSWPVSAQPYRLETSPDLDPSHSWETVAPAPTLVGLRNVVTNPVGGSQRYYRLTR